MTDERIRRPDWPGREIAATVGADAVQPGLDAVAAEGALEGADHRVVRVGRQVLVATLAVGSELEHTQIVPRGYSSQASLVTIAVTSSTVSTEAGSLSVEA